MAALGVWIASALGVTSTLGVALIQVGTSLLLSTAARALMPQPELGISGRSQTVRQPVMPREICYGRSRKGGAIVYINTSPGSRTATDRLDMMIVLAGHRVARIGDIYFNGELAIPEGQEFGQGRWGGGLVGAYRQVGDANQVPNSFLFGNTPSLWTANHRLRGCACVCVAMQYNPDAFPNGIPNITVDVWGKDDVYDPRTGVTGYSENPALCLADYLAHPSYGLGATYGGTIDTADLIEAANVCDEVVPMVGGGLEPRYACNGVITLDQQPKTIIEALNSAMAGRTALTGGQWHVRAGAYRSPTVTIDEDDITAGGITMTTRVSRSENFNAVRGQFVSPQNDWQPDDFPAYQSAAYLAEDGGEVAWHDISLPFTISASAAQRLAKIELERMRRQLRVSLSGKLSTWATAVGDTVALNYARWGMAAKPFDAHQVTLSLSGDEDGLLLGTEIVLRETSPLVYDWSASEGQIYAAAPRTTLPSAFAIADPSALTMSETLYQTAAGSGIKVKATLSWQAAPSAFVAAYQVEQRRPGGAWLVLGQTDATSWDILDASAGQWEWRVKAISQTGVSSKYVTLAAEIFGLGAPPAGLANVTLQSAGGSAILKWTLHPDIDVRVGGTIVIRHSAAPVPSWSNSTSMDVVAGSQAIAVVPLKPGAYLLRAEDASGVAGPVTAISTTGIQALAFAPILTLTEDTAFSGVKTGCIVGGGALTLDASSSIDSWPNFDAVANIDAEGGILPSGAYAFAAGMNLGAARLVRLRSLIELTAIDLFGSIDARPGDVDTWANFDGVDGSEVDVIVEARVSQTDPAGTPAWGPWSRVDSTEIQAWGVEARATLSSVDPSFAPSVTKLRLIADEVA